MFKLVDCYGSDIIQQLDGCSALMWHWAHYDEKAVHFARQLTRSIESTGIAVFPNFATCWHYDDKVGQKYLLEAIGAPLVPTHVFFSKKSATEWANGTQYPKVFKLSGGAGSSNVKLARNRRAAVNWINRSFGRGWPMYSRYFALKEAAWRAMRDRSTSSFRRLIIGMARVFIRTEGEKAGRLEKGYAYFQDFVPGNSSDVRVIVIGSRAFAIRRLVREGDFRASGSGRIAYEKSEIPIDCIRMSFEISRAMSSQCVAFDYVFDSGRPLIVEVSYAFTSKAYRQCEGYWDTDLGWHQSKVDPEAFIIEDLISSLPSASTRVKK